MRIITKFMLACAVVGSGSLTSCKDYSEEDTIDVRIDTQNQLKKMQQQISDLIAKIEASQCGCDGVSIVKNADGTFTVKDKNGTAVTVPANAIDQPKTDANGTYIEGANGSKIYIPTVKTEDGKNYIVIGDKRYEIPEQGPTATINGDVITITNPDGTSWSFDKNSIPTVPNITVSGDNDNIITVKDNNGKTWTFDKSTIGTTPAVPAITVNGDKITITDTAGNEWEFDKSSTGGAGCNCKVTINSDKTVTITDGTTTATIPTGTYTFDASQDNEKVYLDLNGKKVEFRKVTSDVWYETDKDGNEVICIQKYNADGTKNGEVKKITVKEPTQVDLTQIKADIKTALDELYGEGGTSTSPKAGSVADRLNKLEDVTSTIYGDGGTAENPTATSIFGRLNAIDLQLDEILSRLGNLEDARAKQVTGIIVQQVHNPAFGSYNSIMTNVQTNMLVAYYGQAKNIVTFPSNDDEDIEKTIIRNGNLIMKGTGNAGYIYVTINPNTVDFTGMDNCLTLVNSQDDECAVKLGAVRKTDDILSLGYTRAANNGFYVVPATIDPAGLADPNVHINVDKGAIKTALKELVSIRDKQGAKIALKDLANVAVNVAGALNMEAEGVKCSWTDAYGEHSVYSNYNIAALAASPLGFNTVDGVFESNGAYWKAYGNTKTLVTKAAKKLGKELSDQINKQFMLDKLHGDIADIQAKFNHIDEIKPLDGKIIMDANVTVGPFTDIPVGPFTQDVTVTVPSQNVSTGDMSVKTTVMIDVPESYDPATGTFTTRQEPREVTAVIPSTMITVPGQKVTVPVTIPVQYVTIPAQTVNVKMDITDQVNNIFNSMIGDVNQGFKDVNDLIDALNEALVDVNLMLDNINKLQNKLESGSYLAGIYKYMDKIANGVAKYTPELFKPILLVNSDNGVGICGFQGAPSVVSGSVVVAPTTWTAELLTPVFKKYIRVNGGKGQYVDGYTLDITSQLKPGVNTVEYRALDYQGVEWSDTYQIIVK